LNRGATFGVNPVIYNPTLQLATVAHGSQGFRYVNDAGNIVTGDQSINSSTQLARSYGLTGFWEWTHLGGVTIGQGEAACIAQVGNGPHPHRVLEPGGCFDIRFSRIGNACAVAMIKRAENKAVFLWFDVSELDSLPLEKQEPPPPPPDDEPEKPPVSFDYDTGPLQRYAEQRWRELKVQERTDTIAAGFPDTKEGNEALGPLVRPIHGEAFQNIMSELHHTYGRKELLMFPKASGTVHEGFAEDIAVVKQSATAGWYKDVGGAFGGRQPRINFDGGGWQPPNGDDLSKCVPPPVPAGVPPFEDPPVDEPPPLDPSILARLAAIEDNMEVQGKALQTMAAEFMLLNGRVTALENSVPEPAPIPLPDDVVRTSTHEVKASVRYLGTVTGQIVKKG
jgi:hypothetical protein